MFTKPFSELSKHDAAIAGGKGASLGEMTRLFEAKYGGQAPSGNPVPPGFVVFADAFERFLEETDLNTEIDAILHTVDTEKMHTVEHSSETIQKLILEAKMPEDIAKEISSEFNKLDTHFVAVRSSATAEDSASAAWAGQLDSFLNTTEATLLQNVQRCFASLFTPRAIFYRFEKGLHDSKISVAVVVQKMVESKVSGIAFSVHPVTEDQNQLIIEAGFGLGEAIVSGQITPDSYVVEKNPRRIIDTNIADQERGIYRKEKGENEWQMISYSKRKEQKLSNEQILELSEIIIGIEKHYGFPCDIEWAFEGGKFYIVQSRPITTLQNEHEPEKSRADILKAIEWHSDWSGPFSLFSLTPSAGKVYLQGLQKYFGKNINHFFVPYRKGIAFCRLPEREYQELGKYLLEKTRDEIFFSNWVEQFKKTADEVLRRVPKSPKEFLEQFSELLPFYEAYGAYNVATKIVFDVCYNELSQSAKERLEEARKYSETFYKDDAKNFENAIQYIVGKTGYTVEEVGMLTYEEFERYLENGALPERERLRDRWESSGAYFTEDGLQILSGQEMTEIENFWLSRESQRGIVGQVAYKGKARGKCRIVLDYSKAIFEEGEVLITGMTDPHFVPLMKKAAAIVTDGGGMLSHAAIVSRELKKPCIIGTKIATQVLKDGDLVEVDADNGVVRILERRKEI